MNITIITVGYRSVFSGLWSNITFEYPWDEATTFETYLADIFQICNLDPEDHGFVVREDNLKTSLSAGDTVVVDIMGYPSTGKAECLSQGWKILVNPIEISKQMALAATTYSNSMEPSREPDGEVSE